MSHRRRGLAPSRLRTEAASGALGEAGSVTVRRIAVAAVADAVRPIQSVSVLAIGRDARHPVAIPLIPIPSGAKVIPAIRWLVVG